MDRDFSQFLRERLKKHNFSLRRLSELSGISVEHLEHLLKDDRERLPAAPYLRGYLQRLGKILDFEPEEWWKHFRLQDEVFASGPKDELPGNRFSLNTGRKNFWIIVTVIVMVLYLGLRFAQIFGRPVLIVLEPRDPAVQVADFSYVIRGEVKNSDRVFVNNEVIPLTNGAFQKTVLLQPGLNTVEISSKKFLGSEVKVIRQIVYEVPALSPSSSTLP